MLPWDTKVITLGEPKAVLELHFQSLDDESITIGQIVVLWEEIVCRKIGDYLYEIYDMKDYQINVPDFDGDLICQIMSDRPKFSVFTTLPEKPFYSAPKYVKTSKGSKKVKPWEGPVYF